MIAGSVFLGSGLTTFMELGGTVRGDEYDAFDIAGSLSLDGTLQVDLIDAFSPSSGDAFDLFVADEIIGSFAALFFPVLPGDLEWDLTLVHDFDGFNDLLQLSVSAVPLPPAV